MGAEWDGDGGSCDMQLDQLFYFCQCIRECSKSSTTDSLNGHLTLGLRSLMKSKQSFVRSQLELRDMVKDFVF